MTISRNRNIWLAVAFWTAICHVQIHAQSFDIYWVDVEGGAATLLISPNGESLLVDTGFPSDDNRDALRIFEATQAAGVVRSDHLVVTHFHRDHVGGLNALAEMIQSVNVMTTEPTQNRAINSGLTPISESVMGNEWLCRPGTRFLSVLF